LRSSIRTPKQGDAAMVLTLVTSLWGSQTGRATGDDDTGLGAVRQDRQRSLGPPKKTFRNQGF